MADVAALLVTGCAMDEWSWTCCPWSCCC